MSIICINYANEFKWLFTWCYSMSHRVIVRILSINPDNLTVYQISINYCYWHQTWHKYKVEYIKYLCTCWILTVIGIIISIYNVQILLNMEATGVHVQYFKINNSFLAHVHWKFIPHRWQHGRSLGSWSKGCGFEPHWGSIPVRWIVKSRDFSPIPVSDWPWLT